MLGRIGQHGTGTIPKDAIRDIVPGRGVSDLVDTIVVRWGGGGDVQAADSNIGLKSYVQGREKWQGETLHWLWFDEEPPQDIYTEGLTRMNVTQGPVWLTFTPLLGMSDVVRSFLLEKSPDRSVTTMTIDEAQHFTPEQRQQIITSYPAHERDARTKGIPILGSGRIFPISEETITIAPFEIPDHWHRLGAMDFGWDHPFAAVELAWDADQTGHTTGNVVRHAGRSYALLRLKSGELSLSYNPSNASLVMSSSFFANWVAPNPVRPGGHGPFLPDAV